MYKKDYFLNCGYICSIDSMNYITALIIQMPTTFELQLNSM